MTRKIDILPEARDDLRNQARYLGQQSVSLARRFYEAASATFEKLAELPNVGTLVPTLKPQLQNIRVWRMEGFPRHLIFYRGHDESIEVVRILHGTSDWQRLFSN